MGDIIEAKALYNLDELTIRLIPTESSLKRFKNIFNAQIKITFFNIFIKN